MNQKIIPVKETPHIEVDVVVYPFDKYTKGHTIKIVSMVTDHYNDYTLDPRHMKFILSKEELKRLGEQLIKAAEE